MKKNKSQSHLEERSRMELPQVIHEVFATEEEMAEAVDALACFINKRYSKERGKAKSDARGFTISRLKVIFTDVVKQVEFESDFASNLGVIYAPEIPGLTLEEMRNKNDELISYFSSILKDSQLQVGIRLYLSLDTKARLRFREKYSKSDAGSKNK